MRTALQLLGGIAVAGAVAAGTTAFTASGVTSTVAGSKLTAAGAVLLGGSISQSVVGAILTDITFANNGTPNQFNEIDISLTDTAGTALPTSKVVTMAVTAGGTGGASAVTCTTADNLAYVCHAPSTTYWTSLTGVAVTVA